MTNHPPTPPKGEAMPQTPEHWAKVAARDNETILKLTEKLSKRDATINDLRQRLKRCRRENIPD